MKSQEIVTWSGIICIFVGLFVLPWVGFTSAQDFAQRRAETVQFLQEKSILQKLPYTKTNFHLNVLTDESLLAAAYDNSNYKYLFEAARSGKGLSAWSIFRSIPIVTRTIRWSILALLLISFFQLLFLIAGSVLKGINHQRMATILVALNALLFVILISHLHSIDNFGVYRKLELSTLLYLSKARIGWGYPLTLVGLLISTASLAMRALTTSSVRRSTTRSSRRPKRQRY